VNVIQILLQAGIDTSITNNQGLTARDLAVKRKLVDVVSLIDQYGDLDIKGAEE
jgi:hypothetical protein